MGSKIECEAGFLRDFFECPGGRLAFQRRMKACFSKENWLTKPSSFTSCHSTLSIIGKLGNGNQLDPTLSNE